MTPERFDLICDTLYGMVRRVQRLTDVTVCMEIDNNNSYRLGCYQSITIWITIGYSRTHYDICTVLEGAEETFERAKEHLNDILSKASVQFEEIEEVEEDD